MCVTVQCASMCAIIMGDVPLVQIGTPKGQVLL